MGGDWTNFGIAEIIAGAFVAAACVIAVSSIRLHYKHSKQPQIRNFTIRILLMIPVYGIEAWLAIVFTTYAVMFKVLREGYEAFVILSFMQLMLTYLGGPMALARDMQSKGTSQAHMPPMCCLKPWSGAELVRSTLIGVLQYVPASIFVMTLSISTWFAGYYEEGQVSWKTAWIYCAFITNCSQMWALYCLILFYQATKDDLKAIHPLPKFLCVKLIVFFTWWQGIMINLITYYKWVQFSSDEETEQLAEHELQNFIICIEMFLLSIAHSYAFPCQEFNIAYNPRSQTAVLASEWDNSKMPDHFSSDDFRPNIGVYHRSSPRSLPARLVHSVNRSVRNRLDDMRRLRSGVTAAADDFASGVNLLDIYKVLKQTQDLGALASSPDQEVELKEQPREEDVEAGLGARHGRGRSRDGRGAGGVVQTAGLDKRTPIGEAEGRGKGVSSDVSGVQVEILPAKRAGGASYISAHTNDASESESSGGRAGSSSPKRSKRSPSKAPNKRRTFVPTALSASDEPCNKKELAAAWDVSSL